MDNNIKNNKPNQTRLNYKLNIYLQRKPDRVKQLLYCNWIFFKMVLKHNVNNGVPADSQFHSVNNSSIVAYFVCDYQVLDKVTLLNSYTILIKKIKIIIINTSQ